MELLCGEQGETVVEIVTRMGAEDADGASAGAVTLLCAFGENAVEDVEILFHLRFTDLLFTIYYLQFTIYFLLFYLFTFLLPFPIFPLGWWGDGWI